MFIPCSSPPRNSECITANSSSWGTLPKSPVVILEADGTTTIYLIAQAKHPGVILDSFSSSPPTTICLQNTYTISTATTLGGHQLCFLTTLLAAILMTLKSHWPQRPKWLKKKKKMSLPSLKSSVASHCFSSSLQGPSPDTSPPIHSPACTPRSLAPDFFQLPELTKLVPNSEPLTLLSFLLHF